MDFEDPIANFTPKPKATSNTSAPPEARREQRSVRYTYLVERISEGARSAFWFGNATLNQKKLQDLINTHGMHGYRMVFQVKEQQRLMLFFTRESLLVTFERAIT